MNTKARLLTPGQVLPFLPSRCGLHFANFFPRQPVLSLPLPVLGRVPIGDASRGLCGGFVFTVRDFFESGQPVPQLTHLPPFGSSMYRYLVRRLFASFNLPTGPLRYLQWMNLSEEGVWRRTVQREWPLVRAELDAGRLASLGLVKLRSRNPWRMGDNHQVLAYGYEQESDQEVRIHVYDPNHPDDDQIALTLALSRPSAPNYSTGSAVRGFFLTPYRYACPPQGVESW